MKFYQLSFRKQKSLPLRDTIAKRLQRILIEEFNEKDVKLIPISIKEKKSPCILSIPPKSNNIQEDISENKWNR